MFSRIPRNKTTLEERKKYLASLPPGHIPSRKELESAGIFPYADLSGLQDDWEPARGSPADEKEGEGRSEDEDEDDDEGTTSPAHRRKQSPASPTRKGDRNFAVVEPKQPIVPTLRVKCWGMQRLREQGLIGPSLPPVPEMQAERRKTSGDEVETAGTPSPSPSYASSPSASDATGAGPEGAIPPGGSSSKVSSSRVRPEKTICPDDA
ncbi:hypothetical protein JCM8097_001050 [Rhodosporidiobolus ruineniae]